MAILKAKVVEKSWGTEEWIINSSEYCGKILRMNPGWSSSLHYHPQKDECMRVLDGFGWMEVWFNGLPSYENGDLPTQIRLQPGVIVHLPPKTPHRLYTDPSDYGGGVELMEVSTSHRDEDVVRLVESHPLREY